MGVGFGPHVQSGAFGRGAGIGIPPPATAFSSFRVSSLIASFDSFCSAFDMCPPTELVRNPITHVSMRAD